jgi:hypothetical protein
MGKQLLAVGEAAGLGEEIGDIREMLSWSAEWSALHGIAEIRTPIVKVATSTDATGLKYTVRRTGTRHPQEAPHGLNFPYRGLH